MFEYKYIQNVREKNLEETANMWASKGWRLMKAENRKFTHGASMDLWGLFLERAR